ncbi:MAG: flagellar hook-length control protein FliK [Vulcanimicrobiota bacterium]
MLDQTALNSVLNTGVNARETKAKEEPTDAEAFNAVLNDATAGKKNAKKEETKESKDTKEKKQHEAREQEDKDSKVSQQQQTFERNGALRKLMSKNVDTMSLAEKQALRVAEFANADQQNVKTTQQMAMQPQPQAPAAQAAKTGKSARPTDMTVGKEASAKVRAAAERADDKSTEVAEEAHKKETGKHSTSSNLDQALVKEANFADELRKSSAADQARDRQSVIDQILQQIEVRNFANRTELHLKLNPEYLGELKVKLVHTDDGIRADFETASRSTRKLLRDGEEELKAQAATKGVRMRSMKVTLVDKVDAATA